MPSTNCRHQFLCKLSSRSWMKKEVGAPNLTAVFSYIYKMERHVSSLQSAAKPWGRETTFSNVSPYSTHSI